MEENENNVNVSKENVNDNEPKIDETNQSTQDNVGKDSENNEGKTIEDDDSDVEFTDDESSAQDDEQGKEKTDTTSKKNSRSDNRRYAKLRKEAEIEKKKSYFSGIKEGIGGKNPYTNSAIEDDDDVQEYLYMKEMDSKGLDPTNSHDYNKFMREKTKEIEAEKLAKEESTKRYNEELGEFRKSYKDVDIENLIETDENWRNAILPQIRAGIPLKTAYESVANLINHAVNKESTDKADQLAKAAIQKSLATPGSQTNGSDSDRKVNYLTMSDEEFKKEQERRRNHVGF